MALGNTNTQSDNKLYALRIKTKLKDAETGKDIPCMPHVFEVSEKKDGKWGVTAHVTRVSGALTKITFDKDEYEGNEYHVIKFFLEDSENKETYLLDLRATSDFRGLSNSILNLTDPSDVSISLYKTHSDKTNKDYSNVSVWSNQTLVKGKFSWDQLPKVEEIKDKKGVVIKRDTSDLDEFLIEELKKFSETLGKAKKQKAPQSAPPPDNTPQGEDEVPF